jgi:hypothetical protein
MNVKKENELANMHCNCLKGVSVEQSERLRGTINYPKGEQGGFYFFSKRG